MKKFVPPLSGTKEEIGLFRLPALAAARTLRSPMSMFEFTTTVEGARNEKDIHNKEPLPGVWIYPKPVCSRTNGQQVPHYS